MRVSREAARHNEQLLLGQLADARRGGFDLGLNAVDFLLHFSWLQLAVVLIRGHSCCGVVSVSAPDIMETRKDPEFQLKFFNTIGQWLLEAGLG